MLPCSAHSGDTLRDFYRLVCLTLVRNAGHVLFKRKNGVTTACYRINVCTSYRTLVYRSYADSLFQHRVLLTNPIVHTALHFTHSEIVICILLFSGTEILLVFVVFQYIDGFSKVHVST